MRLWIVGCVILGLGGCATQYGEMGFAGGVHATRLDETTVSVEARGNGFTNSAAVTNYLLRKAAEETLSDGFQTFVVMSAQDSTRHGSITMPATANSYTTAQGSGGFATANTTTTYNPGSTIDYVKPGITAMIHMGRGPCPNPGAQITPKVWCAAEVLRYMVPAPQR